MNIKKTALGLGAATALSLSLISGAVAQDLNGNGNGNGNGDEESQTVTAQVDLVDGACAFTLGANDLDFGDLTWDGFQWAAPSDQALTLAVTDGHDGDGCRVTAASEGLFLRGENGNGEEVAVENAGFRGDRDNNDRRDHIGVTIDGQELHRWPTTVYQDGSTEGVDLMVGLNTGDAHLDAGHYSGDIYFQLGRGR